jgi:iron complex outermembrane receptor protein
MAYELGYRAQIRARVSLDLATFFNTYQHLQSTEPGLPFIQVDPAPLRLVVPLILDNKIHGSTDGVEVSVNWKVTDRWTLSPGYSLLQMHLHTDRTSQDTSTVPDTEGSTPRHQGQFRSHLDLFRSFGWDTSVYFVERLPAQPVPSYTRLDTQLSWQFAERVGLSLVGQNLLRDHHVESNDTNTSVNSSQVKRSGYAKITWRF